MAPGEDEPKPEEGPILSPEELDLEESDHVEELEEGRYVVSPEVRTESVAGTASSDPASDARDEGPALSDASVHEWLAGTMDQRNSRYGFDVTAKFDGEVTQQQMVSNDIVTVFESLLLWYARQIDGDTPVEQVLGILLNESNVPVRYPAESLEALLDTTDLGREDAIGDLVDAVEERDGIQL